MTVAELIAKLVSYPSSLEVQVDGGEGYKLLPVETVIEGGPNGAVLILCEPD